jgi:hypothetical protein
LASSSGNISLALGTLQLNISNSLLIRRHVLLNRIRVSHLIRVLLTSCRLSRCVVAGLTSNLVTGSFCAKPHLTNVSGLLAVLLRLRG